MERALIDNISKQYSQSRKKNNNVNYLTKDDLLRLINEGKSILRQFKLNRNKYFNLAHHQLVSIEQKLWQNIRGDVFFFGYIDLIIKDKKTGKYIILDLKTSNRGWSNYDKNDQQKRNQLLLYKYFYAQKLGCQLSDIDIQFMIFKRKMNPFNDYTNSRIQTYTPPNGKPSINKALE